ncbi:MAG: flagellar basal body-associated FliL family protein [Pseudomonadota bacterium]
MADEESVVEESKGGKGKIIIIAVGAIALLAIGIFAGPMVQGMLGGEEPAPEGEVAEEEMEPKGKDALYEGIHPPLLINFTDDRGKARFLQISLELMTYDQAVVDAVKAHGAVIRNNLILLYGDIDYNSVVTRDGKSRMLEQAHEEINKILVDKTGQEGVEAVYFTNLVVQ